MYLKYCKIRDVKDPVRAHAGVDAGIDFFVPKDFEKRQLKPGENVLIPSGIKLEVPLGYCVILFNKSGIASKKSLLIGAQVIDSGYSGEVHIDLHNVGTESIWVQADDKVIQGIMLPIITPTPMKVDENELYRDILSPSDRGEGGFGSTGK